MANPELIYRVACTCVVNRSRILSSKIKTLHKRKQIITLLKQVILSGSVPSRGRLLNTSFPCLGGVYSRGRLKEGGFNSMQYEDLLSLTQTRSQAIYQPVVSVVRTP